MHHRQVLNELRAGGIDVQSHYIPVHFQPYYRSFGFDDGAYTEAEAYAINAITLPFYPIMQKHELQRVGNTLSMLLKAWYPNSA